MIISYSYLSILSTLPILLSAHPSPIPLALGPYLLGPNMDTIIQSSTNVTLQVGTVIKDAPLLSGNNPPFSAVVYPEYPWEKQIQFYTSAMTCPPDELPMNTCNGPASYADQPYPYRIYYTCMPDTVPIFSNTTQPITLCVSMSNDGLTWIKPLLNYFVWNETLGIVFPSNASIPGTPTNAIFQTNDTISFPGSVFLDNTPNTPRDELFKLSYEGFGYVRIPLIAYSSDGFQWFKRVPELPIITKLQFSDTQTAVVITNSTDTQQPIWTIYGRQDATVNNDTTKCEGGYPSVRTVLVASSNVSVYGPYDNASILLEPGNPDIPYCLDNYNPAPIYLHGVTFFLISNFWHFSMNQSGAFGPRERSNDGIQDIRLAYTTANPPTRNLTFGASRDSFISRGIGYRDPYSGNYNITGSEPDSGFVFATSGGLIDPDIANPPPSMEVTNPLWPFSYTSPSSYVYLLYWGTQATHTGGAHADYPRVFNGILRARLRREGFVALRTPAYDPYALATFTTYPVILPDPSIVCPSTSHVLWLLLNVETSVGGYVHVEVQDSNGVPMDGYSMDLSLENKGNNVRLPIGWLTNTTTTRKTTVPVGDAPIPIPANYALPNTGNNQPVMFQFNMKHASLYSWDIQCVLQ